VSSVTRGVSIGLMLSRLPGAAMAKNILIFSDGTGQGAGMPAAKRQQCLEALERNEEAAPGRQIAFYDEGLGAEHKTSGGLGLPIRSKATGLGISQTSRIATSRYRVL